MPENKWHFMKQQKQMTREDWASLQERIDQAFFGDHSRPKKHIYLSREDWERIKFASKEACNDMDEAAIQRLLTPIE